MFSKKFSRKSFAFFFTALFTMISIPAHSETSVYSWQDADGVTTFTDDISRAPSGAEVKVYREETRSAESAATPAPPQPPSQPARVATEGEFAVQLVEELGLSDDPTAEEAADILTDILIVPRLGRWELNQPMTEELTSRLRSLAIAAAESGRITLSPDEVLLAFDTTAAFLGLTIPVTQKPEEISEKASEAPYPLAEAPPLVYVTTPPPAVIYPYYTWFPVVGGFWWNGVFCSGFFVLDTNFFFSKHHDRFTRGHHGNWDTGHIGRKFQNRIVGRHVGRNPGFSNPGRVPRSPTDAGRSSVSNRFRTRSNDGMRSSGTRFSRTSPESRHFPQRSVARSGSRTGSTSRSMSRPTTRSVTRDMSMSNAVRRQPSSYRPVNRMPVAGTSRQSFSGGRVTRPAPSRSFSGRSGSLSGRSGSFSGSRVTRSAPSRSFSGSGSFSGRSGGFSAPSGQAFRMGNVGMNRGGSGFAARGSSRGR